MPDSSETTDDLLAEARREIERLQSEVAALKKGLARTSRRRELWRNGCTGAIRELNRRVVEGADG
jgi:hypothetical protein